MQCVLLVYLRQQIVRTSAKRITLKQEKSTLGRAKRAPGGRYDLATEGPAKPAGAGIFFQFISQDGSEISLLFSGLDSRNGTYASLAFISGVGRKNPSTRCGITAF